MPLLMYRCRACKHVFDVLTNYQPLPSGCPKCGSASLDRARDLEHINIDGATTVGKKLP